jgi:U2-associated protein SR140
LQRVEPERTLTDAQRDEFEDMLRALTLERSQIKGAMGFSLDNADAAGEVVLSLCSFITAIPSVYLTWLVFCQ